MSSPGDVEQERELVHRVAGQINTMLGDYLGIVLEVVDWRSHVAPDTGRPQEVINRQIGPYDIFLGIMWKRFGTPTGLTDSGTEEEYNSAYQNYLQFARPRILFYFNQVPYAPKNSEEGSQLLKVIAFKEKLQQKSLVWDYASVETFADALRGHLVQILQEKFRPQKDAAPVTDFTCYLTYLKNETMYINIRGLVTGEGRVHKFRIDDLYIPLKTTSPGIRSDRRIQDRPEELRPHEIWLPEALSEPRLLIKGVPGAGKTTFLRLIAFSLCQKWLGEVPGAARTHLVWPELAPVPIFVSMGALAHHLRECRRKGTTDLPNQVDSPACLLHFLATQSQELNWGITRDGFHQQLAAGRCLILLDGLDEAANPEERAQLSAMAANVINAYPGCQIVMTSRPAALVGEAVPMAFQLVEIAPLDETAMTTFLEQWCRALLVVRCQSSPARACVECGEREETRDKRQETRDKRQETRNKRQETRDKNQEANQTDSGCSTRLPF